MKTQEEVVTEVQKHLSSKTPKIGLKVQICHAKVHHKDGHWHIPVLPTTHPKRTSVYYGILEEIEKILEEQGIPARLIPTLPEN